MKNFKKSDLKTGMRFETVYSTGMIYKNIAIKDLDIAVGKGTYSSLSNNEGKIIRVWDKPNNYSDIFDYDCKGDLIFGYKEEKTIFEYDGKEYTKTDLVNMINLID